LSSTGPDWSFSVKRNEPPPDAAPAAATPHAAAVERFLDISSSWDELQAAYAVEWPLHLILCRDSFAAYNKLMGLLWATARTQVELELLWPVLLDGRYRALPPRDNVWLRPLRSLHGRMLFFVKNFQLYLQVCDCPALRVLETTTLPSPSRVFQVDVVEAAHRTLVSEVKSQRDFDSVRRAHTGYLAQMTKKSHVGVRPLMDGVHRLLRLCRHLAALVASYTNAADIPHAEVIISSGSHSRAVS
jgi:hypothetical protein